MELGAVSAVTSSRGTILLTEGAHREHYKFRRWDATFSVKARRENVSYGDEIVMLAETATV